MGYEMKEPVIFGDRLAVIVKKAHEEIVRSERIVVEEMRELFDQEDDVQNLGHILVRLENVHGSLMSGDMVGDIGARIIRNEVLAPFRSLVDRMIETRCFPELRELDDKCR